MIKKTYYVHDNLLNCAPTTPTAAVSHRCFAMMGALLHITRSAIIEIRRVRISYLLCCIGCCTLLNACSSPPPPTILSQHQQYEYDQAVQVRRLIMKVQDLGAPVYVQGDTYQIIIPTDRMFKGLTSQLNPTRGPLLQAIVNLLNAQNIAAIQIDGYTSAPGFEHTTINKEQLRYSLTQSWGNSLMEQLRENGLKVGLITVNAHGQCDNIGTLNAYSNRIELNYRISHET